MVQAVRGGSSMRAAAAAFGMSLGAVAFWVARSAGSRLDRVDFAGRKPGRAANRTPSRIEQRILALRERLRRRSVLGEYGADAIAHALHGRANAKAPSRATIHRVLARCGALDGHGRQRRPAPPQGWHLAGLAGGQAELDSFDFIEDLKIAAGPLVSVLTGTSLHGALAQAWVMPRPGASATVQALIERWRAEGLPAYAQFDNDTIFQGAHQHADSVGRVSRLCLALGIIPVFAPPREPGFQNAIEGFNALWQAKVWQRHQVASLSDLRRLSKRYIEAYRAKTSVRAEAAPARRVFPADFVLDLDAPLRGLMIFLRRSNDAGAVNLLGRSFAVDPQWVNRLVRCEVDFSHHRIRCFSLRRREPTAQPLLREIAYRRSPRPFLGKK